VFEERGQLIPNTTSRREGGEANKRVRNHPPRGTSPRWEVQKRGTNHLHPKKNVEREGKGYKKKQWEVIRQVREKRDKKRLDQFRSARESDEDRVPPLEAQTRASHLMQ
jgi:hypothetical protein